MCPDKNILSDYSIYNELYWLVQPHRALKEVPEKAFYSQSLTRVLFPSGLAGGTRAVGMNC
jgi:hypothetical protein